MCNCLKEQSEKIRKALKVDNGMIDHDVLTGKISINFCYIDARGGRQTQKFYLDSCPICNKPYVDNTVDNVDKE